MTTREVLRSWTNGLGAKGAVWGGCLALVAVAYAISGPRERPTDMPMLDPTWAAKPVSWVDRDDPNEEGNEFDRDDRATSDQAEETWGTRGDVDAAVEGDFAAEFPHEESLGDFHGAGEGPVMFVAKEDDQDEDEDEEADSDEARDRKRGRHAHSGPPGFHWHEARPAHRAHQGGGRGPKHCDACDRRRSDGPSGECDACAKRRGDGPGHPGHGMHHRPMGPPPGAAWGGGFGRGPHGRGGFAAARHGHPGFGPGPGMPVDGPQARLMHLQRAARHLNAAGMKELSEQVRGELEKARQEAVSQSPRGEQMQQRLDQLHQDVEKLHGLIERLAGLLPKVSVTEPAGDQPAQPTGDPFTEPEQAVAGTVDSATEPSPDAESDGPDS